MDQNIPDQNIQKDFHKVEKQQPIRVRYSVQYDEAANTSEESTISQSPAVLPCEHYEVKMNEKTKRLSIDRCIEDITKRYRNENHEVITVQPQSLQEDVNKAASSIPDIQWPSVPAPMFPQPSGLDYLRGVQKLIIQQTVELNDMLTKIESTNRYMVKEPNGETLYLATEMSTSLLRMLCGPGRAFTMSLHDKTRRDAIILSRRLAGAACWFPCRLQAMQVSTLESYLGRVKQQWTLFVPFFLIRDCHDKVIYLVRGPENMKTCCLDSNLQFDIINAENLVYQGTITNSWDSEAMNYSLEINFPLEDRSVANKALIIAAAFLLEYTYFERGKSNSHRCLCL